MIENKQNNPFLKKGQWYKGNLHAHTRKSDGELSLADAISEYKMRNYDFLAITDHWKMSDGRSRSTKDFLCINGEEIDIGKTEIGDTYHIVAIGLEEVIEKNGVKDAKEVIGLINKQNGIAILAHPYWSGLNINDMLAIDNYVGIEIYNSTCSNGIGKGYASTYWDQLLAKGKKAFGFADDDSHHLQISERYRPSDYGNGWIMIKAGSLELNNVLTAIRNGDFYSSNGPVIDEVVIKDGKISVRCSESKIINFIANGSKGRSFTAIGNKLLKQAEYEINGSEKYIRIECHDTNGKIAWSNAFFFDRKDLGGKK